MNGTYTIVVVVALVLLFALTLGRRWLLHELRLGYRGTHLPQRKRT